MDVLYYNQKEGKQKPKHKKERKKDMMNEIKEMRELANKGYHFYHKNVRHGFGTFFYMLTDFFQIERVFRVADEVEKEVKITINKDEFTVTLETI